MNLKILYTVIDGEITGGNIVALRIMEEVLKKGGEAVVNSASEGKFTEILRTRGLKVYNIDTRRSFRFDNAIKLARIIKKENINLVHSHGPLGVTILSRLAGRLAAVPVINHAHLPDNINTNSFAKYYHLLLNWLTSRFFCAKIIAVSESIRMEIARQGAVANKISVVYNGIDLDGRSPKKNFIKIREEFGLKQNQWVIAEVARICESKGQHILIKAAQRVIKEKPNTVFMIIGEDLERMGEYKKELEVLAGELGIRQNIIFTGYRQDIADLMNTFDIFVLPSLEEGLPVAILEAMAAMKAVIATSVGGNPEIVIDGSTGTLVEPQSPDKLAKAIIYHLENPEISKRMGEQGYDRVKKNFSLSQMLDKVMRIYKEVL